MKRIASSVLIAAAIILTLSPVAMAAQVNPVLLERIKQPPQQQTITPSITTEARDILKRLDPGYPIVKQLLASDGDLDGVLDIEPGTVDECPTTPYMYVRLIAADWSGEEGETWVETTRDGLSSDIVLDGVRLRLASPVVEHPFLFFPEGSKTMPPGGGLLVRKYNDYIMHIPDTNYNARHVDISDNQAGIIFSRVVSIPIAWIYEDDPHYQLWHVLYPIIYRHHSEAHQAGYEPERPGCPIILVSPDVIVE